MDMKRKMQMRHPVRDDLLRYLQSYIEKESEKKYENSKSCCCYCKGSE